MCQLAIEWHEKAIGIKKDQHFSGNPRYVLAYVNLGEIYRTLGQIDKSYTCLNDGLRIHGDMRANNSSEALNRDYRYLYLCLQSFCDLMVARARLWK